MLVRPRQLRRRLVLPALLVLLVLCIALPAAAAPLLPWLDAAGQPLPFSTEDELLDFLRHAPVVERRELPQGLTRPHKLTLAAGDVRLHAVFRRLDQRFQGTIEALSQRAVRDSYRSEVAAYELDRLLGLGRVPPTVLRTVDGEDGAVQLWIEGAVTRAARVQAMRKGTAPPDRGLHWVRQRATMRLFDVLIHNVDRHHANMLVTSAPSAPGENPTADAGAATTLWYIDHTRAFQPVPRLLDEHERLALVDRELFERLRRLDEAMLRERLDPYLDRLALDAFLRRRRLLVARVEERIARWGEGAVLVAAR